MAVEIGTATNYRDLLDKLRLFLTTNATLVAAGQHWEQLRWNTTSTTQELILRGKGLAGTDNIYVGITSNENLGSDWFNWHLNGFTGFDSLSTFYQQAGTIAANESSLPSHLHLWNSSIPYWFIADGRRFIVICKVSTMYFVAYMGFLLPYSTPSQIPYPMCILGQGGGSSSRWSAVGTSGRAGRCLNGLTWSSPTLVNLGLYDRSIDSNYPLAQLEYRTMSYNATTTRNEGVYYGELDGMFSCSGRSNGPENTIDDGPNDHLVVPDGSQQGLTNFIAVRLS